MHIGSFDNEPATVALMDTYLEQNGYVNDINKDRLHHEIYMSDARKVAPEKWKTVIRHPIKKAENSRLLGSRRERKIGILLSMTRMKIVTVAPVFTSVA